MTVVNGKAVSLILTAMTAYVPLYQRWVTQLKMSTVGVCNYQICMYASEINLQGDDGNVPTTDIFSLDYCCVTHSEDFN